MNIEEWGIMKQRERRRKEEESKSGYEKNVELMESVLFFTQGDMAEARKIIEAWLQEAKRRHDLKYG